MLGLLINEKEQKELEYLLKKEMDELLFEVTCDDFNAEIKNSIKKDILRYSMFIKDLQTKMN